MTPFMIGTAGWSIARRNADSFPEDGGGLERYAARFSVVEINSSFHRAHRLTTWERWRDSVPADFRFSVKVPKRITHEQKLIDCSEALDSFFGEATALREKLAVVLVQLPPKQEFGAKVSTEFFTQMTARSGAQWSASRATFRGSRPRPKHCSTPSASPEWPPIRRFAPRPPAPAAGRALRIDVCTAHP